MTLINPIFSEWKSVGLELTIPMMYHTWVSVIYKALKKFVVVWCGRMIIVSALYLSLRDKGRLSDRESLTIKTFWFLLESHSLIYCKYIKSINIVSFIILRSFLIKPRSMKFNCEFLWKVFVLNLIFMRNWVCISKLKLWLNSNCSN